MGQARHNPRSVQYTHLVPCKACAGIGWHTEHEEDEERTLDYGWACIPCRGTGYVRIQGAVEPPTDDPRHRTPTCDCIASGNPDKPKQHGADPHAKNCAVYRTPTVLSSRHIPIKGRRKEEAELPTAGMRFALRSGEYEVQRDGSVRRVRGNRHDG